MPQQLGHYQILHSIGKGAFAEVFLGEHIYLNRRAAIKVLQPQSLAGNKNDFIDEARTAAQLNHPHIIPVWDFGIENKSIPYLVMEYADNGTLREIYLPGKIYTPTDLIPHLQQITEALTYVHQKRLIHRDIKPANMLLDSQKGVLLSDFGISSLARQSLGGTPTYMAPEQIQQNPTVASDQYALAVVVYEWLCERCPFLPKNLGATTLQQAQEICEQHIKEQPLSLRQLIPALSLEVEQVILRALKKDPAERFASVEDFYQAFVQAARPGKQKVQAAQMNQTPTIYPSIPGAIPPTMPAGKQMASPSLHQIFTANQPGLVPPIPTIPIGNSKQQGKVLYIRDDLAIREGLPCGAIHTLTWSPDGKWLAAGTKLHMIFTWHAFTGDNVRKHRIHKDQIFSLAWSPDGQFLASGSADQILYIWEPENDLSPLLYRGHGGPRFSLSPACPVCWSPDGSRLASAGADATIQVWLAASGKQVLTCRGHSQSVNAVCWSPDGSRLASASDDQTVRLWNATSGTLLETWQHHNGYVYALNWSPDGTRLASGGSDSTVYVWEPIPQAKTQNQLIYQNHIRALSALAWSPDGALLASGGSDQVVQIWDAANGQHRYTYKEHKSAILALAWSPDGRYIASADENGTVHVWQST